MGFEPDSVISASFDAWRAHQFPRSTRHALMVRPDWRSVERVGGFVRSLLQPKLAVGHRQKLRPSPPELPLPQPLPSFGQPADSRARVLFIDPCAVSEEGVGLQRAGIAVCFGMQDVPAGQHIDLHTQVG